MALPNYTYTPSATAGNSGIAVTPGLNTLGAYVTIIPSTVAPLEGLQLQLSSALFGGAYLVNLRINGIVSATIPTSKLGAAHLYISFPVKIPAGALVEIAINSNAPNTVYCVILQISPQVIGASGVVSLGPVTSNPLTSGVTVAVGSGAYSSIGTTAQAWKGLYLYQGWNNLGSGRIAQNYEVEVWTGAGSPTQKLVGWLSTSGAGGSSSTDLQGPFYMALPAGTQLWMRCNAPTPDPTHSVNCNILGLT